MIFFERNFVAFFLTICCLFIGNSVFAQKNIQGAVKDELGFPLRSVNVHLISKSDTLRKFTDKNGIYKFDHLKENSYQLAFSLLGYSPTKQSVQLYTEGNHQIPDITLTPSPFEIKDVNVLKVVPIVVNGDTIQFNFGAYDFRKNSLLEEALKNLPGFQVARDGSVYYNGKILTKVKVDNKEFFGGDLLTATRNLPADFIKNIQVIDFYGTKESETGILGNESEKILNITLKEDKKKIYFGQITGGVGTNERYLGSFGINKFDDGKEVSVLGSFNNTNTNLFSYGNVSGGERGRNSLEIGDYSDPIDGLNTVSSIGLNLSDRIGTNTTFNASYNFIQQDNITEGNSQMTSTYIGNTISRRDDYTVNNLDNNHKLKFAFDTKFKNKDVFKAFGNVNYATLNSLNSRDFDIRNHNSYYEGDFKDSTNQTSPNGDLEFMYSKFFNKKGRKLVANINLNSNNVKKRELVRERYFDFEPNGQIKDTLNNQTQFIKQNNFSNSAKASVSFVEPFFEHSLLEVRFDYDFTAIEASRLVEDQRMQGIRYVDSLSLNYDYTFRSNRTSLTYQYEPNNKFKMNLGFAVQPLVMEGELIRADTSYSYENVNLIPTANIIYKLNNDTDWQISYQGKNIQPSFHQIAPVVDNSNSINVIRGNPELKAEFSHRIATTLRKSIASKMQYFETNLAFNIVPNKIVSDKKTIERTTTQETSFKNTSGYYDWRWYYIFNTPFINENLQLDLTGNTDYYNTLSYIDDRRRTTKQFLLNQSMQLKYILGDHLETMLHANYVWNRAEYDIPFRSVINVETMYLGLGGKAYFTDNISMGFEMSQRYNDGYRNSFMNVNQTVLNGYMEFTFFPNKSALLRLQAYDIFDQNKNMGIISEYVGNDIYEARNNRLGRYFMLSLNIRLQKFPKNK